MDFSALLKEELRSVTTRSEWAGKLGGQEVTLYAKPLTPADNQMVLRKYPTFNQTFEVGGMAMYVALKAEDENGKKAFSVAKDLPMLLALPQAKIGELFRALCGSDVEEIPDEGDADHETRVGN